MMIFCFTHTPKENLAKFIYISETMRRSFQEVAVVKNPPANAGDIRVVGSIPGSGRSPGGRHGNPLQYSCLEYPHGQRSLAGYSPWGHKQSDMTEATEHACMHEAMRLPVTNSISKW